MIKQNAASFREAAFCLGSHLFCRSAATLIFFSHDLQPDSAGVVEHARSHLT
jgi:hypothetical protein